MTYLNFAFSIILNGTVFSILGVLFEKLLVKYGVVRGKTIWVILECFFIGAMMRIVDSEGAYLLFSFAASILIAISLNRSDLISSLEKGRWWWKSQNNNQD